MESGRQGGSDLGPGATLAGYRIDALLGEGAMGSVFRATRLHDEHTVALKVVRDDLVADETYRRRFLHEARAAAEIEHPHLIGVLEAGEADGRQFLAMRFLDGSTLEERLRDRGTLSVGEVVRLGTEIGGALGALHEAGLVHRDVKAANILLDRDGAAALTDFGLAKGSGYSMLTMPGSVVGTLDYLAPERIRGEEATAASDVYALGCVVVEALTGLPPFGGKSMMEVGFAHLEEPPADPCVARADAPSALGPAILAALAKSPADRPSAQTFADGLRSAVSPG